MSDEELHKLYTQFSYFIATQDLDYHDWKRITTEQGACTTAQSTERFFQSWEWSDDDRANRTLRLLKKLDEFGETGTATAIMSQAYELVGGADPEELEEFPTLQAIESLDRGELSTTIPVITHPTEPFLDITNTRDDFYDELIANINDSYRMGVYDGAIVLTRKLLENLVIDLLRKQYPRSEIDLYYDTDWGKFHMFSTLLETFESKLLDFKHHPGVDATLLEEINTLRTSANSDAHSIVTNRSQAEMEALGDAAEHAAKVMFRTLANMD
ncbi:hypothetical protein [Halosegnis marinus]|uniref:AbiJ N-terminal domain-containing protein n=1 Tax=Halosegnis marinus TaxID=3034023 RepID=A0ABD5ZT07_9EURY|nr:hypothetical protein [Halosegnis sp. DT85]